MIVIGTWFMTIGQILDPHFGFEKWDLNSHKNMMIVTMMFAWDIGGAFLAVCFIGANILRLEKKKAGFVRLPEMGLLSKRNASDCC